MKRRGHDVAGGKLQTGCFIPALGAEARSPLAFGLVRSISRDASPPRSSG